jgi:hypothetical protein
MAKFLGFDIATYEELTGSSEFDSRRRLITNKQRIPYALQRGDQSTHFDKRDVISTGDPIIIKLDEELNYVRMAKSDYQNHLFRMVTRSLQIHAENRGAPLPPSLFNTISSSINTKIADLPNSILFIAKDTAFTGSYNITKFNSNKICYSGIANQNGYFDRTFNNNSPTATGASWSFANSESTFVHGTHGNQIHQLEYTASFVLRTWASGSHSGSHITSSYFYNPFHSQSRVDSGKFYNYEYRTASSSRTGSVRNISTAGYYTTVLKANIFGDGNETLFSASFNDTGSALYAQDRELLTFPYDTVVASGSFLWCNTFEVLVGIYGPNATSENNYQPIKRVELYWASGSGGLILSGSPGAGLSGSISPNQILPDSDTIVGIPSGSHLFYDNELSTPASGGYYTTAAKLNSGSLFNLPSEGSNNSGSFVSVYDRMFEGPLRTGAVIHIAGEGINNFGDPGQFFAQNPFKNAHESSSSKVIPAATRWNGQSFSAGKANGEVNPGDYDDSGDN